MGNCHNTITVDAPIDAVWDRIVDFHDMSWAPNVVESIEAVGAASSRAPSACSTAPSTRR